MEKNSDKRGRLSSTGYRPHAYYIQDASHERLKAAWWGLIQRGQTAPRSLSALVEDLILHEAQRLEEEHNNGEPFDPAPQHARVVDPNGVKRQSEAASAFMRRARKAADSES